jgi:hypothetical protein
VDFSFEYKGRRLTVKRSTYQYGSGQQLAILCFVEDADEMRGMYGALTVNLDDPMCEPFDSDYAMQYIDVNNWPGIEDALAGCDWCQRTGDRMRSGFVEYPLYIFSLDIPEI